MLFAGREETEVGVLGVGQSGLPRTMWVRSAIMAWKKQFFLMYGDRELTPGDFSGSLGHSCGPGPAGSPQPKSFTRFLFSHDHNQDFFPQ